MTLDCFIWKMDSRAATKQNTAPMTQNTNDQFRSYWCFAPKMQKPITMKTTARKDRMVNAFINAVLLRESEWMNMYKKIVISAPTRRIRPMVIIAWVALNQSASLYCVDDDVHVIHRPAQ